MTGNAGLQDVALKLFRGLAESYDRTVDIATLFQDRRWKAWVARNVSARNGGLILDVGCGTLLLEQRSPSSEWRFVGLDVTEEMARVGWAKSLANVVLVVNGDGESLPFPDSTFDSAISCYVPKYVTLGRLAAELARVVKPGGAVVLYDFAKPRGIAAPFLEAYIQVGLRIVGLVLRRAGSRSAYAFERLPGIIDATSWDREVVGAMEARGFMTSAATPLTGGVVFAYCGRKKF